MSKKIVIGIIVLVLLGGGAYLFLRQSDTHTNTTNVTNTQNDKPAAATITYSDSGYSPASVTVKSGEAVEIKNTSSHAMQFDSDPHPIHTNDPELNVGSVNPGESMKFTVSKTGTFGYHNHLNPSDKGTIIVK